MPPKKKTNKTQSAQLNASSKARVDKTRKVGNANAVAAGVDMSRVAVISDRELMWIRRLAYEDDESEEQDYRKQEEQRRKQLSNQHKSGWSDTIEARQGKFLQKQAQEKEEAEARRQKLDELYALEEEEKRREANARLELQNLLDDPRGRNVKSVKALNETIKAREQQIEENKKRREAEKEDLQKEIDEILMKNWGDNAEEMRQTLARKQRELDIKNANMDMLMGQIEERKKQRQGQKLERIHVDQEAAEEAEENRLEEQERRLRDLENGIVNKANSRKAVTKAQKLEERKKEDRMYDAKRKQEEEKMDSMKQSVVAKRRAKQQQFEERKQAGFDHYTSEVTKPDPKYRTQDVFEKKGQNFLEKLYEDDVRRVQTTKELNTQAAQEYEIEPGHHRAEATRTGYLTREEEEEHLREMRTYPERVKAEQDAEEAARLAAAQELKREQRRQADEKRNKDLGALEQERNEDRMLREKQQLDDEEYRKFIDSQLPPDINPVLRKKAHELQ